MATLSTLELMLHAIQNQESLEPHGDHGRLPVLPQRPVSKARMPTIRARRAILSFHLQEIGGMKEDFVDHDKSKRDRYAFVNGGLVLSKSEVKNEGHEKAEKGIIVIQKCFRAYQARFHYHKLKEGIITLQSFVRGEIARRGFRNYTTKGLTQTHVHQEFVWKPLRNRETTIIYLQSVIRSWLSRRQLDYTEDATIKNEKETDDLHNENIESEEHVMVSESYIHDLEKQVLRTEAALRHKIHENSILELQIQQIDRNWELHKAKMNSKEKLWQDEFASIQMNLALAREKTTTEIACVPQNPTRDQENGKTKLTIRQILELQESVDSILTSRKGHEQELQILRGRFKAWKKEFTGRLHDIKKKLDRSDNSSTKRVYKSCFVSL